MVLPMYSAGGCSTAAVGAAADPVVDRDVVVVADAAVEELEAVGPLNENADAESVFFSSLADESAAFGAAAAAAAPNEKPDAGAVVEELPVVVAAPDVVVEAAPNETAGAAVAEAALAAVVLVVLPKPKPEDEEDFFAGGSAPNPNPLLEAVESVVLGAAAAAPKLNPDEAAAPSFLGELGLNENELVVLLVVLEPAVAAVLLAAGAGAEAPKLNPELGVEGAAAAVVEAAGVVPNAKPPVLGAAGLLVLAAPNEKPPVLEAAGVAVAAAGAALPAPKEKLLAGAAAEVAAGVAAAPKPKPVEAAGVAVGVEPAAGVADAPPKENPPVVAAGAALVVAPKEKPEAGAAVGVAGLAPKENPPPGAAGAAAGVPKEKPPLLLPSVLAPKLNAIRFALGLQRQWRPRAIGKYGASRKLARGPLFSVSDIKHKYSYVMFHTLIEHECHVCGIEEQTKPEIR